MGADATADSRQHVLFTDQVQCLLISSLGCQGNISLGIDSQRTICLAEWLLSFVDKGATGERHSRVKGDGAETFTGGYRTGCSALAAKGTFFRVNKGLFLYSPDTESLRCMFDGADSGRQDASDGAVAHDPYQSRSVGIIKAQAGAEPEFVSTQLVVDIRLRLDQGYRYA